MFLKSVQIRGFKSFADKALLELEPGITVVVGPNGSGKSNVVDAIAWVLGAQAPTSVRSSKMDDVIFAGTAKRPALGRAEVSLTIDNSAGLLPVDFSEVTITRTLFRSGDSDYAINGVTCRLLDIQELLSDAGVGRNQHVIVSQGQIDAILNARPEERRSIIEEAAGILKYRRRKERAERRLAATEVDLSRVSDLQREIRRQLRPLERQARAAEEHGRLSAELASLRAGLAGQELVSLRARVAGASGQRTGAAEEAAELETRLASIDQAIRETEAELRRHGGRELSELLARFDTTTERIRGLGALLDERQRNAARLASVRFDEAGAQALREEAAEVERALQDATEQVAEVEPLRAEAAAAEATVLAEREALLAPAEGVDPLVARAGEVRREVSALRSGLERASGEVGRLSDRQRSLTGRLEEVRAEQDRLQRVDGELEAVETELARAVQRCAVRRADAENDQSAAEEALREAQGDQRGTQARVDVLAGALDAARARAGAARLRQLEGVVGTLLDAIQIDPGWEIAFEAAAGEALTAVVVADVDVARAALELLSGGGKGGAVLPLRVTAALHAEDGDGDRDEDGDATVVDLRDPGIRLTDETPGVLSLARVDELPSAPWSPEPAGAAAAEPIRAHVRGRDAGMDRLLDDLLAGAVLVRGSWDQALAVAVAHPELVVVSDGGDRFGPQGWRVGSSSTGVTGAMLEEARQEASAASGRVEPARRALEVAREATKAARRAHEQAVRAADEHAARDRSRIQASEQAGRAAGDLARDLTTVANQLASIEERNGRDRARLAELEVLLPSLEAAERDEAARAEGRAAAEADLDQRRAQASKRRMDLEVAAAHASQRLASLQERQRDIARRVEAGRRSQEEAELERQRAETRLAVLQRLATLIQRLGARLAASGTELRAERRRLSDSARAVGLQLDRLRLDRAQVEAALSDRRSAAARAELELAESTVRLEALVERIRRELGLDPDELARRHELTPAVGADPAAAEPSGTEAVVSSPPSDPRARVSELEAQLAALGPINALAVEEFSELQERTALIEAQVVDVKESRRELQKVISAIDEEITLTFAAAFADVAGHFEVLFATLFPGGAGSLRLTTPDDLLNTGIDVEAKPSGKNVRKLSLLSGGERALTALGLLFAIFRSRPSPFYVMDEVEAALDEVNLRRFLALLDEFRTEAQLVVVSHQRRTMEIADCLYGVSMKPGDSSKVVSERLRATG